MIEMRFTTWLEVDEEHPFQQWHKEYMSKYSPQHYRSQTNKSEIEKIERDKRATPTVVEILSIRGYSVGQHSFGGDKEISAKSPLTNAQWEIKIKTAEEEMLLKGKTVFIVDESGGSFHEQWANIRVYAVISDDEAAQEKMDWEQVSKSEIRNIKGFFTFESVRQVVDKIMREYEGVRNPVKSGEDQEAYWARIIKRAGPTTDPVPRGFTPYSSKDDYYK